MQSKLLMLLCGVFSAALAFAGEPRPDEPVVTLQDNKIYRTVNGESITGRDVFGLLMEKDWDTNLQAFIEYQICEEEIAAKKITVSDPEVDTELQAMMDRYAEKKKIAPSMVKLDAIVKELGMVGGVASMRRSTKINLGLLKVFQKDGKVPATAHTWDAAFKEKVNDWLDKAVAEKGVVKDPKKLGAGEACRIGSKSYSRDEVVDFMRDLVVQIGMSELKEALDNLSYERIAQQQLKAKNITLNDEDWEFHFSYLCRRYEMETGVPGRMALAQDLQAKQMTIEQFVKTRAFRSDAGFTRVIRNELIAKPDLLKEEFKAHPDRYARTENLCAHILIRVLDPDGRVYTSQWKAPGHGAVNEYVRRKREEQFESFKPKIDALVEQAKADFEGTAKKYSEDLATNRIGGKIGRIGKSTILLPPLDNNIRDAAMKLKPGEISAPVRSDFGWHLIKCLEQQDVTFEEAAERVYARMLFEGREKLVNESLKNAKIDDQVK